MRETLGPPMFATQTAPGETATRSGCAPTRIVAVTWFVFGSIRETVFLSVWRPRWHLPRRRPGRRAQRVYVRRSRSYSDRSASASKSGHSSPTPHLHRPRSLLPPVGWRSSRPLACGRETGIAGWRRRSHRKQCCHGPKSHGQEGDPAPKTRHVCPF